MNEPVSVHVVGIEELHRKLVKAGDDADAAAAKGLEFGGQVIVGAARLNIRNKGIIDLGGLLGGVEVFPPQNEGGKVSVEIGTALEHGIYHEFGTGIYAEEGKGRETPWVYFDAKGGEFYTTSGVRPRPWLRPALDENRPKIEAAIVHYLHQRLEKMAVR
jgi:hypothetical protein